LFFLLLHPLDKYPARRAQPEGLVFSLNLERDGACVVAITCQDIVGKEA
jgi:hypothetical protein